MRWKNRGELIQKLRLYEVLSTKWKDVSDLVGLTPAERYTIDEKYSGRPDDCTREVVRILLSNNPSSYTTTWNGMVRLLEDVNLMEPSKKLKEALEADFSTLKYNLHLSDGEYLIASIISLFCI